MYRALRFTAGGNHLFYWLLKHGIVGPYFDTVFRPWVVGEENIPKSGPVIIAGNHLSVIDSFVAPLVMERRVYYLAKSDYFTGRGITGKFTKWFMQGVGQLPIDRSGGKASEASLNTALKVLGRGDVLGIYPEGTRSPDGKLYRGRTGVARMVLEGQVPVVPCVVIDTERVMPPGQRLPRAARMGVIYGKPLDFSRYYGMTGDRFILRSITDEIMYEINRLGEQEYVDVYATSVKAKVEAERNAAKRSRKRSRRR